MTAKDMLKILRKDGWEIRNTVGSHIQMKHPTKLGIVTVSNHKGDMAPGTLANIKRQAGLK